MTWLRARDYSVYQGDVNFNEEPIDIALIKMSGGDAGLYLDPNAAINYQKAINAGKGVMGWHFLGANIAPDIQAQYAAKAMMPFAVGDVYGVDFEVQVADPVNFVLTYEQKFHSITGAWSIPYINGSTINSYDWSPVFDLVLPWVAWWGISPDQNVPIKYPYIIQQYNDSGKVVSNGLPVDEDAVFLTLDQFKAYGYHAPVTVSEPAPVVPTPQPVQTTVSEPKPVVDTPTQATTPVATTSTVPEPVAKTTTTTSKNQINTTTTQNKPLSTGSASTLGSFPIQTSQVNVHDTTSGFWTRLWNWFLRLIGVK